LHVRVGWSGRFVALGLLVIVAGLAVIGYNWVQIPLVKFDLGAGQCKFGPPLAGVYIPDRLQVLDRCSTVTGTVDCLRAEPDGDTHLRLSLDPQFARFLTSANSLQTCANHSEPHLVVEIIPQHPEGLLFRDNNADAGGFVTPDAPAPGDHIAVTGPHVIDKNILHRVLYEGRPTENWAEIHPAWAIRIDRQGGPGQPNQFGPDFGD
jgi:hypothetical protein